jgi:membrane AbrB-like protein
MDIIIFYALSILGWRVFEKLKIPTPAILGPIVALCSANFFGLDIVVPVWLKPLLSIIMGIMLGLRFNLKFKGLLKEILLVGSWIILISLVTAQVLLSTGLDKSTALFGATPGGIAEISLMAMSFGANIFVVALLQSTRLLTTMIAIPMLTKRIPKKIHSTYRKEENKSSAGNSWKVWGLIIPMAVAAALILGFFKVSASSLIGPMLAVGIYTKTKDIHINLNKAFQKWVQIGVGGLIGLNITKESLLSLPDYLVPILYLNLLIVGGSIILGFVLHRISGWDLLTCLLSTAPAGLTPIVLLSLELNADSNRVVLFQMLRFATVVLFAPLGGQLLLGG